MTIRSPIFTPGRIVDSPIARQFVAAGLALLTAIALPVGQAQFEPTHPPLDPKIARDWTRTNDLPRQLQVTLPQQLTDWPLPKRAPPQPPEGPPINVAAINTVVVATQAPFALLDWPLPNQPPQASRVSSEEVTNTLVVLLSPPLAKGGYSGGVGGRKRKQDRTQLAWTPPRSYVLPADIPKAEVAAPPMDRRKAKRLTRKAAVELARATGQQGILLPTDDDEEEAVMMLLWT